MLPHGHDSRSISIHGGQGGSGGEGHGNGTGGPGGPGHGPTVNITAQQIIVHNLHTNLAPEQAFQLSTIQASSILNHCPLPSRIFQGRRNILDKMYHFFTDGAGGQHIYVLYGLGGAGKTQIALKFIKESASSFSNIFFIDTSDIDKIDTGLKNIAIAKHIGQSSKEALQWLACNVDNWLLFFDNADDPSIDLNEFLPQCDHGNIIITSRNRELCHYAGSCSLVSDLEGADAVTLLLKSARHQLSPKNEQIASEIVMAGAFIFKSRALDSYLDLYAKHRKRLLSQKPPQSHDSYAWTVYTTWQMSYDRLRPQATMLLQCCSFLHYKGITEGIFSNASKYGFPLHGPSKEELQQALEFLSYFLGPTGEWDSLCFLDVTNEIQAYSLIDFDSEKKMFSIHPLVHAWSREIVRDFESMQSTVGAILGMAIPQIPKQDIQLASVMLLPHVESILGENLEVGPYFRDAYAQVLSGAGKYRKAEKLQIEVLERCRELLGDNDLETWNAMCRLAATYSKLGEFKKAQELDVVVFEKQKQDLGDNHPGTLAAMSNLAATYSKMGELDRAKELQIVVLKKQTQFLGDNHLHTLATMGTLASTYSRLRDLQSAKELQIVLLGDNHLDTLAAMCSLASTYSRLGEFKKAQELYIVVLKEWKQFLGDNHPDTLRALDNLASTCRDLGELKKAQELKIIVLGRKKQLLGENHPDTVLAMDNLAGIYWKLGEFTKAAELMLLVYQKHRQTLGDNHPHTLRAAENLRIINQSRGKLQEEKEFRRHLGLPAFENTKGSHSGAVIQWPVKWLKKLLMGRDGQQRKHDE
ncbi:hypothetical protein B0H14DRAFT_3122198 [Mycena olivaceomarginata]|nr:hypothetical protein B0H14DRAFT_3122198 [Mycena olivaceomarginata]